MKILFSKSVCYTVYLCSEGKFNTSFGQCNQQYTLQPEHTIHNSLHKFGHYTNRFFGKSSNDRINMIYSNGKLLGQDNVYLVVCYCVCVRYICVFVLIYQPKSTLFSHFIGINEMVRINAYIHCARCFFIVSFSISVCLSLALSPSHFHFRVKFLFNSHPT